jgi:hypothetical protein
MTIDVDRLAVDADYWDEVAPDGASHFMHTEKFVKWVFGVEWVFYASSGREWKKRIVIGCSNNTLMTELLC